MNFAQQKGKSIDEAFAEFDLANPHIYKLFEERVFQSWLAIGYASAKTIICKMREEPVRTNRTDEHKINDAFTACYARKFQQLNPDFAHYLKVKNLRRSNSMQLSFP